MSPERIAELRKWVGEHVLEGQCLVDVDTDEVLDLLAVAEQEAKLREAVKDYLKWVRTPHHHLPIQETINQRREILERMETAVEQKGGE